MGTNNCNPPRAVLLALLLGLAPSLAGAQPVVPDGSTATTVGMNAGKTTVLIAPVTSSGLSHNRYTRFDVPAAGVDLDNRAAGAQTIINEVTGNQRSLLTGPLTVLGARAQVLIANPNGIKVDGGSFHNTGGLALTTGSVGFADRQVTPFLTQRNALVTTADGEIEIGPGGLSGLFTHLVLAAKQLTVSGPVTNANADRDATLQLIAGGSELEFDSSVLPGSLSKPWLQAAPRDAGATTALLVDITRPASLSASNIQIAVTARGAGVRLAGEALATAGDFYLASNGEVRLSGAKIDAAENLRVEKQHSADPTPTVVAADDGARGFALTAGGHIEILSDNINLTRGRMATDAGDIVLGCKDGNAAGDFRFVGVDAEDGLAAGGGIGLYAQGQDMYLAALTVTAASAVEIMANKFSLNRTADGESALGGSGIYIAADGDVLLTGEIATLEDNFHLQTNGRVELDEVSISAADSARIERLNASGEAPAVVAGDFTVSAENHVEIFSNAIDLAHGAVTTVSGHIMLGNSGEAATGDFRFVGTAPGDGLCAGGGIGIYARGRDAYLAQLDIYAADGVAMAAKNFTLARGADAESSLSADAFYLQATGDVRLTGDLTTATGDLLVAANQAVLLDGARMQAGRNLRIEQLDANLPAPTVTGRAGGGRGFLLGADGEVAILSGAVDLQHGQIITQNGAVILGRQDESAAGDFRFVGADADDGIYSAAGLGIYARGKDVLLEKLHLEAAGLAEMVADNFTVADRDSSVSVGGFDLAATGAVGLTGDLRAADGDWRMATNGAARVEAARLAAAGNIVLEKLTAAGAAPTLTLSDFALSAGGDIELQTGANELRHGTLTTQAGSVVIGSVDAAGDFCFVGEDADDGIYSAGGIGLYAPGQNMRLENLPIQAAGLAEVLSNNFTLENSTVSVGGFALAATGQVRLTDDTLTATQGDWRMAANDEVRVSGVQLTAAGGIWLGKLNAAGAAPTLWLADFALSAVGNIELQSGANELRHGTLTTQAGSVVIGSVDATGNFNFIGVDADDGIYAGHSVGLYAPGQSMWLEKIQITANSAAELVADELTVTGRLENGVWLPSSIQANRQRISATGQVTVSAAALLAQQDLLHAQERMKNSGHADATTKAANTRRC